MFFLLLEALKCFDLRESSGMEIRRENRLFGPAYTLSLKGRGIMTAIDTEGLERMIFLLTAGMADYGKISACSKSSRARNARLRNDCTYTHPEDLNLEAEPVEEPEREEEERYPRNKEVVSELLPIFGQSIADLYPEFFPDQDEATAQELRLNSVSLDEMARLVNGSWIGNPPEYALSRERAAER